MSTVGDNTQTPPPPDSSSNANGYSAPPPHRERENSTYSQGSKGPLPSLHALFKQYAKTTTDISRPDRKPSRKDEDPCDNEPRICLIELESWFTKANIFNTSITNVTVYDVRNSFWKMDKMSLTFKDFERYIDELAKFRKIHPDVLLLRLRLSGDKNLDGRVFHYTVPEGNVDRYMDAFRLNAEDYKENFLDLSTEPYEEPVCFGGVRGLARKAKSQKEEEAILTNKAKEIMKKGESTTKLDPLNRNFVYFAKNGNYFSDGRSIALTQLIKWMKQAEIIDGERVTAHDIGFLFKRLYTLSWRIYLDDLYQFFHELSLWKNIPADTFFRQLRNCKPPASSSMSIVEFTITKSMGETIKDVFFDTTEDYQQNLELYEPKSQDTPYGHTPNSRNRHYQDAMEEDMAKVHSSVMEDMKKKTTGGQGMMNMNNQHHHAHTSGDADDKDDTFPEEKRGGKDYLTKRWNDAYPIGGMDGSHRPHMEQDLDKLMFGADRADDSSSDDEEKAKKKMKARYGLAPVGQSITNMPIVPLEEQFEKYKRFGEHSHENGITLHNVNLWFSLAGMIAQATTLFTVKDVEEKYNSFKFAREQGYMEYDAFLNFLASLCEKNKKKTHVKEVKERLARCGPPADVTLPKDKDNNKSAESSHRKTSLANPAQKLHEEVEEIAVTEPFRQRYNEFSRFGESTVQDAYSIPGISMLNANKWFKQSGIDKKGVNLGDVDVFYKQLYPAKLRISLQDFCKVIQAISASSGVSFEVMMDIMSACGSPVISEIPHYASALSSKQVSQKPSKLNHPG